MNEIENEKLKDQFHICLSGRDVEILENKARDAKMNETSFVRWLLRTSDFSLYEVKTDDLKDFIHDIHESTYMIYSLVDSLKRNGNGNEYVEEIDKLVSISEELRDILKKQLRQTYFKRNNAYTEKIKDCVYGDC